MMVSKDPPTGETARSLLRTTSAPSHTATKPMTNGPGRVDRTRTTGSDHSSANTMCSTRYRA
jgi:hypothetical protein